MKIFVSGVNGQLGYDIQKHFSKTDNVIGTDINDLDITSSNDVTSFFEDKSFDVFIHCAAYTNVEAAEDNKDLSYSVNVEGTKNLLEQAKKQNAIFIYFSTDYVFDGSLDMSKKYIEDDITNPINIYGHTKELGEQITREYEKHYILRISWVYGKNGHNFVKTMLKLKNRGELTVISDQIGSPTYTKDVAENLLQFISSEEFGTYHFTNSEYTSWSNFARYIFHLANIDINIKDIPSVEYPTKAKRPYNSQLSQEKLIKKGFTTLPTWKDAVKRYLIEIGEIE